MVASAQDVWQTKYAEIEKSIQAPAFKSKLYKITKFGASTKASAAVNQKGINAAIEKCSRDGGGKVVVPKGVWNTGAIRLKSHVNLDGDRDDIVMLGLVNPRSVNQ